MAITTIMIATVDPAEKEITFTGDDLSIREEATIQLYDVPAGAATASLILGIELGGTLYAYCDSFTDTGSYLTDDLDLNTTELVNAFENMSGRQKMSFNMFLWDSANSNLIANDRVRIMYNPYSPSMTDPSPVGGVGEVFTTAEKSKLGDITLTNCTISFTSTDSSERAFAWTSAKAGDITVTLEENFTINDGYDVDITAEDAATSIVMDNANFEVENGNATQRDMKLAFGTDANATLTIEGTSGVIDQDLTQDASPTFDILNLSGSSNQIVLQSGGITGTITGTPTLTNKTWTLQDVTGTLYQTGGTDVALADGGTNNSITADNGAIPYSDANKITLLAATATANQIMLSGSNTAPSWSTATYPATTTVNQLLYSSSANVIAGLATGNSGVLVTSGAGVPSIGTDIPTAVTIGSAYIYRVGGTDIALADGGTNNSLTADNGAIPYSDASKIALLASTATANQLLMSGSSAAPSWSTATYPATTTINQILYSSAANTVAGITTGNSGILVTSAGGVPSIATDIPTAVTIGSAYVYRVGGTDVSVADGGTGASTLTDHGVLVGSGTSAITALAVGTDGQVLVGSTGADPVFATITDGEGITTTLGAGTLQIDCEDASETNKGILEIATDVEATAASATDKALVPNNIGSIKLDDFGTPDDNTDLNFTTTYHGLVPKGTNVGDYLKDDGTWGTPAGAGDMLKATYDTEANGDISTTAGGTNADSSGWTGVAVVSAGTWSASATLTHELGGLEADVSAYAGLVHITGGATSAKTIGIADDNIVEIDDAGAADDEYCRFTANGIEGRTVAEVKTDLGIDYQTIYVDGGAFTPCTTNGAATGTNEYGTNDIEWDYFAFDGGATEERIQFKLPMPENWDRSTVKVKFYWSSATGSTSGDTVEWGIKAGALSDSDAIDAALGTAQVISDTLLADNGTDLQISGATPALTVGGTPALGDMITWEVYRNTDGTDDMAEDAWLFGVWIQYKITNTVSAW